MAGYTVLITGASRGIGRAAAKEFAKHGARLALCCLRSTKALEDFSSELRAEYGVEVKTYIGDVSDYSFIWEMHDDMAASTFLPDIIINNAGISVVGLFTDLTPEMWTNVINTNLTSIYNTCNIFVPDMVHRKSGRIINISSVWGNVGASCEVAYSASKGGINAFTKALAKELAPSGIQVNAIAFGAIDTEMNGHLDEEERAALGEEIPVGRMGTPEEAGEFIYGMSTSSLYLTGQVVTFDGAWT